MKTWGVDAHTMRMNEVTVMNDAPGGVKKPVNIPLREKQERELRRPTTGREAKERRIAATIRALNEHEATSGAWGEEYSTI